mmetsp:Transcript_5512/g.15592  ORF Transcript_5512/g.15592 Transcript_5512/m.15592 type:complete len:255 (-) Transcript_5512:516-1280(-)
MGSATRSPYICRSTFMISATTSSSDLASQNSSARRPLTKPRRTGRPHDREPSKKSGNCPRSALAKPIRAVGSQNTLGKTSATLSSTPKPRRSIASRLAAGSSGEKAILFFLRTPSGTVTRHASPVKTRPPATSTETRSSMYETRRTGFSRCTSSPVASPVATLAKPPSDTMQCSPGKAKSSSWSHPSLHTSSKSLFREYSRCDMCQCKARTWAGFMPGRSSCSTRMSTSSSDSWLSLSRFSRSASSSDAPFSSG